MIDQHPEPQTTDEADRIGRIVFIEREITYWMTLISMWTVGHILDLGDDWPWWLNWIVGAGLALAANLLAHGHIWKKGP